MATAIFSNSILAFLILDPVECAMLLSRAERQQQKNFIQQKVLFTEQKHLPCARVIVSVSLDSCIDIKIYLFRYWPICRVFQTLKLIKLGVMLVSCVPDTSRVEGGPKKKKMKKCGCAFSFN